MLQAPLQQLLWSWLQLVLITRLGWKEWETITSPRFWVQVLSDSCPIKNQKILSQAAAVVWILLIFLFSPFTFCVGIFSWSLHSVRGFWEDFPGVQRGRQELVYEPPEIWQSPLPWNMSWTCTHALLLPLRDVGCTLERNTLLGEVKIRHFCLSVFWQLHLDP